MNQSSKSAVRPAKTDRDILDCFPVMAQLRTHLDEAGFLEQVKRQGKTAGYQLAFLAEGEEVVAVAGYRILENLARGKFLYVDDLVTRSDRRSRGYGKELLAWLLDRARQEGCDQLRLDSLLQRHDAHRFYSREGLDFVGKHFSLKL